MMLRTTGFVALLLGLIACKPGPATIENGTYELVGARSTVQETMAPWAGSTVSLVIDDQSVTLELDRVEYELTATPWPRADWVEGCWTMQGMTAQEVWEIDCDPLDIGLGYEAACPAALIAECTNGGSIDLRDVHAPGGSETGCGDSDLCWQFQ